jgi:hypothetical protein
MGQKASLRPGTRKQERMGGRPVLDDDVAGLPHGAHLLAKWVVLGEEKSETPRF